MQPAHDSWPPEEVTAVTGSRPGAATVRVLRDVHARVGETFPRPPYDGFHVTWDDLARPSYDCRLVLDSALSLPPPSDNGDET